jgi:hypothetical protein
MREITLLIVLWLSFTQDSISQISVSQITKNKKYNSVHIYVPGIEISKEQMHIVHGTGFFIRFKTQNYLVSCYHILVGRIWEDTTYFERMLDKEPPVVRVRFHTKNENDSAFQLYRLKDDNGNRNTLSIPVDKATRRAIDFAFLKIDSIPNNAIVNLIDLDGIRERWKLKPNSKLLTYGYSNSKRQMNDKYSYCDTNFTLLEKSFSSSDYFVLTNNTPNVQGSSGSPVFDEKGNFIGIHFAVIPPEWHTNDDYSFLLSGKYYSNPIGVIITSNYLKESLNLLLK